jgi:hypothetical protein
VKSAYSTWEGDDRAAFAVWNNWLLVASHTGALRRLLERTAAPEAEFEASRARWREGVDAATPGIFLLRADRLGALAAAWSQATKVMLQAQSPENAAAWGPGLDATARWARVLGTLGEVRGVFREESPWLHVDITAGGAPAL